MQYEYIYALTEADGIPKYVGRTNNLKRRLSEHIDESTHGGTTLKCGWINSVLNRGGEIKIKVLETVPYGQLGSLEYEWQDELEWAGLFLYNGKRGDRGAAIDEVQLRAEIKEWKKPKKKPLPVVANTFDGNEYQELLKLYETNRPEYERIMRTRKALQDEQKKQLKKPVVV